MNGTPDFPEIIYSQSWEDPEVDRLALAIGPHDDVLTIAASGDNALAFLLDEPRSLTALDVNLSQCCLMELKMAALATLGRGELLDFVGVFPAKNRRRTYRRLRDAVSAPTRAFWDEHPRLIERGILHVGRFERYLGTFRRFILPLVHSRSVCDALFACRTLEDQRELHRSRWDGIRWRALFRLFFSRSVMGRLGRYPGAFRYVDRDVACTLLGRARRGLTGTPTHGNWFLAYILYGTYGPSSAVPAWLDEDNHPKLRRLLSRVTIVNDDARRFVAARQHGSFSKFCLSDIFESLSEEDSGRLFRELWRAGREEATLSYREMMVPRVRPTSLAAELVEDRDLGERCRRCDRTFFYGTHHVVHVHGKSGEGRP